MGIPKAKPSMEDATEKNRGEKSDKGGKSDKSGVAIKADKQVVSSPKPLNIQKALQDYDKANAKNSVPLEPEDQTALQHQIFKDGDQNSIQQMESSKTSTFTSGSDYEDSYESQKKDDKPQVSKQNLNVLDHMHLIEKA